MMDAMQLTRLPLFTGLSSAALAVLARAGEIRRFRAGQSLWREGQAAAGLHVVIEGEVRVTALRDGRRCVLHAESAGATLGDVPLFAGGCYPATAEAVGGVACFVVGRDVLAQAIAADPELALRLLGRLAQRVRVLIGRVGDVTALSVRARLLGFLEHRAKLAKGSAFTLGTTQALLAEELGTVREVLVRELRLLRDTGRMQIAGKGRYLLAKGSV